MFTAATIATVKAVAVALSAIIGVGYAVVAALKKKAEKKKTDTIQQIDSELKEKMTDEERKKLQDALNDIVNS